jgi:hypothetical protein
MGDDVQIMCNYVAGGKGERGSGFKENDLNAERVQRVFHDTIRLNGH